MTQPTASTAHTEAPRVGQVAPDFALPDPTGRLIRLSDYRGVKNVVLYFYPKDYTPGCTTEACAFRDQYEVFKEAGAEVIGVSMDSVESHRQFATDHRLPFILLSDADGSVSKLYQVSSLFGLWRKRITFVIDQAGVIRHIFESQLQATKHIDEALKVLRTLQ
ncbi:MAG: peroxiredoxin [Anaerolineae bacterium]|nr:peroxiredoxin [Thermoflexales bacterium]MDW8407518.1 peroxiredoxin [Anaerolineae bacterium]